jgi:hypothetical protein
MTVGIEVGFYDVGSAEAFGEWQDHLETAISQSSPYSLTGSRWDATTQPFIHKSLARNAQPIPEVIRLALLKDFTCWVEILGEAEPDNALVEAVAAASRQATDSLGARQVFRWTSLLTADPSGINQGILRLASDAEVGPFQLQSTGRPMTEPQPSAGGMPNLGSYSIQWSIPILVRGSSSGWSDASAAQEGATALAVLCSVLSVAWNEAIIPRAELQPERLGDAHAPSSLLPTEMSAHSEWPDYARSREVEVPDWGPQAWQRLGSKPWLAQVILAFREGLRAQPQHPSLALVAYMSAIEGIASRLFTTTKCAKCDARLNIAAGFRAAVALVLTDDEDRQMVQSAYGPRRSKTVHEGRLHSHEIAEGAPFLMPWGRNDSLEFQGILWRTRTAAQALCWSALTGQLPPKRSLTAEELSPPVDTRQDGRLG